MILLFGSGSDAASVFSHLKAAHSSRRGILSFFTCKEARIIRVLNREARTEVGEFEWNDSLTRVFNVNNWRASFPKAMAINVWTMKIDVSILSGIETLILPVHFPDTDLGNLTSLKNLDICNTSFRNASIARLTNLQTLNINFTRISDEVFKNFPKLSVLRAGFTPLTNASFKYFGNLTELSLSWNTNVTDEAFDGLKNIQVLKVWRTRLSDRALLHLPENLRSLDISCTSISDRGIAKFKNLEFLDISGCRNITYKGVRPIINGHLKLRCADCSDSLQTLEQILRR